MDWLGYLSIGLFIWSITILVDRFALAGRIKDKKLYTCLPAFIQVATISLLIPFFNFSFPSTEIILLCLLAGLFELISLYYLFTAMSVEEITRVLPMVSIQSFLVLFLSWFFLRDPLVGNELIAFLLFTAGGSILAFKGRTELGGINWSKALKPLIGVGLFGSLHIILLKHIFNQVNFWTGFYTSRFGLLLGGIALVLGPWRKDIIKEWKNLTTKIKHLVTWNQVVGVFGHVFVFFAVKLENAALVSSAMGIQHAMVFFLATALSLWNPKLLKEDLESKEILKKIIGICLVGVAIYFLNAG